MNILGSVYFKDFARYFLFLENTLKNNTESNIHFCYVALYPCAANYLLDNNAYVHSAYRIRRQEKGRFSLNSHTELVDNLIDFNVKAMSRYGRYERGSLRRRAITYLNYFDEIFRKENFDLLISSGDSRLLPQVLIYLAKQYSVPVIYFEQGPFGTTTFDSLGVNANSSFDPKLDQLSAEQRQVLKDRIFRLQNDRPSNYWKTFKRSPLDKVYDIYTLLCLYPPKVLNRLLPKDLQIGLSFFKFVKSLYGRGGSRKTNEIATIAELPKKYIVFFLQVPVDAQLIDHSPYFSDFYEMLVEIFEAKPAGYNLVIREHPQYRGKYSADLYNYITRNDICIANDVDLGHLLENASVVIVNNSTVGIEALFKGKKVVTLGNSIYSNRGVTFDYHPETPLAKVINDAIESSYDKDRLESFFYSLLVDYLFLGHFQDNNLRIQEEKFLNLVKQKKRVRAK
ncbi:hypothetical protein [Marinobacter sp.]|uniref:capsular polysaccharide export protein, LipB/KpsS family n=1 Tax=Marinobacter sp. TaxID=50741 RepID=UPI0035C6622E